MVTPKLFFHIFMLNVQRLCTEKKYYEFLPVSFPDKIFFENIRRKSGLWGNYPSVFTLVVRAVPPNFFSNLRLLYPPNC